MIASCRHYRYFLHFLKMQLTADYEQLMFKFVTTSDHFILHEQTEKNVDHAFTK